MPDENLGDIMGDVTKRRGRVLGMGASEEKGMRAHTAEVPIAEMGDFDGASLRYWQAGDITLSHLPATSRLRSRLPTR